MNDFKKSYKPGGARQGGFSRPSFGGAGGARKFSGGGRDFAGSTETFKATCSKCNKDCQVPFRPNGKKPVFCKDCFVRDDARDERPSQGGFEKRSYGNDRPQRDSYAPSRNDRDDRSFAPAAKPVEDPRIGAMQRELTVVHEKLDLLIQNLESSAYAAILTSSSDRAEKSTKAPKSEAPLKAPKAEKKIATKAAPKKVAKKAAKKK